MLVSLASAGLVDYLSNSVSGSVGVSGPVFYTANSNELIINEEPITGYWNKISDESYSKREWVMDDDKVLNGIDFYKPKLTFFVNLDIDDDFNVSRGIDLEFGYYDSYGRKNPICSIQYISITENGLLEVECPTDIYNSTSVLTNNDIEDVEKFYYAFESLSSSSIDYEIKTKDSYVEITGVAK